MRRWQNGMEHSYAVQGVERRLDLWKGRKKNILLNILLTTTPVTDDKSFCETFFLDFIDLIIRI